ncbi:MAG: hypothetical protein VZQ55_01130 [Ruminococcus sp.]|nr:hypothetical protein [Ruminococcus sp.]
MIVAFPKFLAYTYPDEETVATFLLELFQLPLWVELLGEYEP